MTAPTKGETQNVEYKEAWRDEYLKWVCGFANAQGGRIYIGVNDEGEIVGVADSKRLLEDIPNKISSLLGIVADVNLLTSDEGKEYLEIAVEPSNIPIAFRGVYHYRSGATKQELKGTALQQFILKKMGRSWDEVVDERASMEMLDRKAVNYFLHKAIDSSRLDPSLLHEDTAAVLDNLRLADGEGRLTNAALLLFGKDPQRFFPSAVFRIGRFGRDEADLMFQDSIEGNILQMADRVMEVLRSKYLVSPISYKGMQRLETLEIPEEALRELLYNAIVHKWYGGAHTQMRVYNDHVELWNDGKLPEALTAETLKEKHASYPRNNLIASVFYKAGLIEAWGRGIHKVCEAFQEAGLEEPTFQEFQGGMLVNIPRRKNGQANDAANEHEQIIEQITEQINGRIKQAELEGNLLKILAENPYASYPLISERLAVSVSTARRAMQKLRDNNRLVRRGSKKTGYWEIVRQDQTRN